jgi:hypothetical protein
MRFIWTGIDPDRFETFLEAYKAKRRAVARRQALVKPEPVIVRMRGRYLIKGALILGRSFGWTSGTAGGPPREVLIGTPVKPPRPKHRKGKRSPRIIERPPFRHP